MVCVNWIIWLTLRKPFLFDFQAFLYYIRILSLYTSTEKHHLHHRHHHRGSVHTLILYYVAYFSLMAGRRFDPLIYRVNINVSSRFDGDDESI